MDTPTEEVETISVRSEDPEIFKQSLADFLLFHYLNVAKGTMSLKRFKSFLDEMGLTDYVKLPEEV